MKLTFALPIFALMAYAGSSSHITLVDPEYVGSTQLKPGDYKVEVEGNQAKFKSGKEVVEVPATVKTDDKKHPDTSFETNNSKITEIHIGGTNTTIVLNAQ